jgi:hypothetical protein
MLYLATILITLLLAAPAMSVALFRNRGAAKDGFGRSSRMRSQRSRYVGWSRVIESSATGTRGTLTIRDSIASISEKSETTQGKSVPSG